jgi:hypothetical protein
MKNRILSDTFGHLARKQLRRRITELHLTRYFTTVELDEGSVGACMSYYRLPDAVLDAAEDRLCGYCQLDPLLVQDYDVLDKMIADCIVEPDQRYLVLTSFIAAIGSAISAPFIRDGGDEDFMAIRKCPCGWASGGAQSALVVGFGGYLRNLVAAPGIKKVHIIDLCYFPGRTRYETQLAAFRTQFPDKSITASCQLSNTAELRSFDVVHVTGSALCNGTLEYFLENVRKDATVILQGQSASLHPKILFESGVKWIATTLKPKIISQLAREDHSGDMMRPLLEGGLPELYLVPRTAEYLRENFGGS